MLAEQLTLPTLPIHTKTRQFFKLMFPNMAEYPKRKKDRLKKLAHEGKKYNREKQYIFIGKKGKMVSVSSLHTLFLLAEQPIHHNQYYSNNGYYRSDRRLEEYLRWLNSYVLDFDKPGYSQQDILDLIERTGLPRPTALVATASGGWHITYIFSRPVRATYKAIKFYEVIMTHMINDLGADIHAKGANRIYRIPNEHSLKYFDQNACYDFEVFKEWRNINHPFEQHQAENQQFYLLTNIDKDLMKHAAIQQILSTPAYSGDRDVRLFNLTLAMKASQWPQDKAEAVLFDWYERYCEKTDFTKRSVAYKINYLYNRQSYCFPSPKAIEALTGMKFSFQFGMFREAAKDRKDRERSHLHEWIADLLKILEKNRSIEGTQKQIAERLSCPLPSIKAVLKLIKSDPKFHVETTLGRNGKTVISLAELTIHENQTVEEVKPSMNETVELTQAAQEVAAGQASESRSKGIISVGNVIYGLFQEHGEHVKFGRLWLDKEIEKPPD